MKTLIIGGSGKIGKYLLEKKNKNYINTYNKKKIRHGIHFNIAKDNLNKLLDKFPINKIILLSAISNPDEWDINLLVTPGLLYTHASTIQNYALRKIESRADAGISSLPRSQTTVS